MADKIKITISPVVAAFVRPGTALEVRQTACAASLNMDAADCLTLLFCLSKDIDPAIRSEALAVLENMSAANIIGYLNSANPHPLILALLRSTCKNYPEAPSEILPAESAADECDNSQNEPIAEESSSGEEEPVDEDNDVFLSKYKAVQLMGIADKIKMALSGDKEWRAILVKDSNKLVSGSVIKNPRITEGEILTLVKSGIQNDEIMRLICANKEWIKNYNIRKALIENNRTPVQNAMRYLGTMGEKDLAFFAKSRNVASVISTMAKRMLLNKKK